MGRAARQTRSRWVGAGSQYRGGASGGLRVGRVAGGWPVTRRRGHGVHGGPDPNSGPNGIADGPGRQPLVHRGRRGGSGGSRRPASITEFSTGPRPQRALEITAGPDGNSGSPSPSASAIGRITPAGVDHRVHRRTAAGSPLGIAAGPDGNLWFTEFGGRPDRPDHARRGDHRVHRRPHARQRPGRDRGGPRRQPLVHRGTARPHRADHSGGRDHRVRHRPHPEQLDRAWITAGPGRQPVVHRAPTATGSGGSRRRASSPSSRRA